MRWLIHGNISPAAIEALNRHGHSSKNVVDVVPESPNSADEVLKAAQKQQLDVLTTDRDLVQRPFDTKQKFGRSIVYLQLDGADVEQDDAVDRLFARYKAPKPGMLYTVTENRVKVRQLPGL